VQDTHIFPDLATQREGSERQALTFQEQTRRFQSELLRQALEESNWNVTEAAQRLDLARSHVYNLIHIFGLTRNRR